MFARNSFIQCFTPFMKSRSLTSNGGRDIYDLVVVGGGMAGLALSCAIGKIVQFRSNRVTCVAEFMCYKITL